MQTTKNANRTQKQGLKKAVLKRIKADADLIAKLVAVSKRSYPTIMRWISDNSKNLTQADCLQTICGHLKLQQSEVLF